jgi:hypothetical protein
MESTVYHSRIGDRGFIPPGNLQTVAEESRGGDVINDVRKMTCQAPPLA